MRKLLYICVICSPAGWCAEPDDLDFVLASSLPRSVGDYLRSADELDSYALAAWINPYYLQADFNGDGWADTAILTREKGTNKGGILIIHGTTNESIVLGAGTSFSNAGDDFSWMDAWFVYPRGVVWQGATEEEAPPALSGDALMVVKLEAASAIVYWTGTAYAWYQQGD
jgi:hypothetical protein